MKKWLNTIMALVLLLPLGALAQTISNVYVASSTATTATVVWTTSTAANSQVSFGINNPSLIYSTAVNPAAVTSHSVTLTLLNPVNTYYFAAVSGGAQSTTQSFQLCNGSTSTPLAGTANNYYEYGSYTLTWVPPTGSTGTATLCGQPITTTLTGPLTGSGSFSASVANSYAVTPGPGIWHVTLNDVGSLAPISVTTPVGSQSTDVSQQLMAAASTSGLTNVLANLLTGQFYPAIGGGGSITGVAAGTGLAGGGTSGNVTLSLGPQAANTVLGSLTNAAPSGLAVPSCSGALSALTWTIGLGFGCNTISGGSGTVTTSGSPTANAVPVFTAGTVIGPSKFSDDGTTGTYSGTGGFTVNGSGTPAIVFGNGATLNATQTIPTPYSEDLFPPAPFSGLAAFTLSGTQMLFGQATATQLATLAKGGTNCNTADSFYYSPFSGNCIAASAGNVSATGLTPNYLPISVGGTYVIGNSHEIESGSLFSTSLAFSAPQINFGLYYDGIKYNGMNIDTLLSDAYNLAAGGTNGASVYLPPLVGFTMHPFVQPEVANAVSIFGVPLVTTINDPYTCSGPNCDAMIYSSNLMNKQFSLSGLILDATVGSTNYHANTTVNTNHNLHLLMGGQWHLDNIQALNGGVAVRFPTTSWSIASATFPAPPTLTMASTNSVNIGDTYWVRDCPTSTFMNGVEFLAQPGTTSSTVILQPVYTAFVHATQATTTEACVLVKALNAPEAIMLGEDRTGAPYSLTVNGTTGGTATMQYTCDATGIPVVQGSANPTATGTQPETMGAIGYASGLQNALTSSNSVSGVCPSTPGATGMNVRRTYSSAGLSLGTFTTLSSNGGSFTDTGQTADGTGYPSRGAGAVVRSIYFQYNPTVYEGPTNAGTNYPPPNGIHTGFAFADSDFEVVAGKNASVCPFRWDGINSKIVGEHGFGYAGNTQAYMPLYGICEAGSFNRHSANYFDTQYQSAIWAAGSNIYFDQPFAYFTPATGFDVGTFTGSISGNVLTVTVAPGGTLGANQYLNGLGVTTGTYITSLGTGTGGTGTYNLNNSMSVASESIGAYHASGNPIFYTSTTNFATFPTAYQANIDIEGGAIRNMPATGTPGNATAFTTYNGKYGVNVKLTGIPGAYNYYNSMVGFDGSNAFSLVGSTGAGFYVGNLGAISSQIQAGTNGNTTVGYFGTSSPASVPAMYLQGTGPSNVGFGNVLGIRELLSNGGMCIYAGSGSTGTYQSNSSAPCYLTITNSATAGTQGVITSTVAHYFSAGFLSQPAYATCPVATGLFGASGGFSTSIFDCGGNLTSTGAGVAMNTGVFNTETVTTRLAGGNTPVVAGGPGGGSTSPLPTIQGKNANFKMYLTTTSGATASGAVVATITFAPVGTIVNGTTVAGSPNVTLAVANPLLANGQAISSANFTTTTILSVSGTALVLNTNAAAAGPTSMVANTPPYSNPADCSMTPSDTYNSVTSYSSLLETASATGITIVNGSSTALASGLNLVYTFNCSGY